MKTVKFKFLIPVLAVALAVTSAFTTVNANVGNSLAPIPGYIDAPTPCMTTPISCLPTGNVVCKSTLGQQVYGKFNINDTTCPRVVYKN